MTTAIKLLTRIIMNGCLKAGVTKTTTTVNLSYQLYQLSKKILVLNAVMAATEFLFPTEYKEHRLDGVKHIQDVKSAMRKTSSSSSYLQKLVRPPKRHSTMARAI